MDWIVTTDMGVDDQISLLFLAKISQLTGNTFNIKAVLTDGNGLSHALPAKTNAVRLMRYAGIPKENLPPVGTGDQDTLDGFNQYPPEWRDEEDNLRGAIIPDYREEAQAQNKSSTAILKDILTNSQDKISILSLGTFTTLAQVLNESPKLAGKIEKIVCMAGAVNVPGNLHGALNKAAEFNAWIDSIATKMVFESGIPITMVPLDATNKAPLTRTFLNEFREKTSGSSAKLVDDWWEGIFRNPVGEYYHWDPLATAIAVSPDIITRSRPVKLYVDASPRKFNQPFDQPFGDITNYSTLNWRGEPRKPLNPYIAGATQINNSRRGSKIVNVVFDVNVPLFEATMISAFSEPTNAAIDLPLSNSAMLHGPSALQDWSAPQPLPG